MLSTRALTDSFLPGTIAGHYVRQLWQPDLTPIAFQARMAGVGFVAGLIVVIPVALWQANVFSHAPAPPGRTDMAAIKKPTVISANSIFGPSSAVLPNGTENSFVGGSLAASASATTIAGGPTLLSAPKPAERPVPSDQRESKTVLEERLVAVRILIADGEILPAREALLEADLAGETEAVFLLAQTYDPNVLAALGAPGIKAEVELARSLYQQAVGRGHEAARRRLADLN